MHYPLSLSTDVEIKTLEDLPKLKIIMEATNMKPNISKIARDFDCDRRTAKRYYDGNIPSGKRVKRSSLDAHYDLIMQLLAPENIQTFYYKASLWRYLVRERILTCPESTFRHYIASRPELQAYFDCMKRKSPPGPSGTVRFETDPGEQAQIDWKEDIAYETKDGEIIKVNVLVMVLGYSRLKLFMLTQSRIQSILIACLIEFFILIGGIPRYILSDNLKTVMDDARTEFHPGTVNKRFDQFSKDMGFTVLPCIGARAQTKGKVESTMKIIDDIHAYQGKLDYEGLQKLVQTLNHEVNMNVHPSTGHVPLALFKQIERESLLQLPSERVMTLYKIAQSHAKVGQDGLFSYKGCKYSVPADYVGKTIFYEVIEQHLHIYDNTQLIASHVLSTQKLNYLPEHYSQYLKSVQPYRDDISVRAQENLRKLGGVYRVSQ